MNKQTFKDQIKMTLYLLGWLLFWVICVPSLMLILICGSSLLPTVSISWTTVLIIYLILKN